MKHRDGMLAIARQPDGKKKLQLVKAAVDEDRQINNMQPLSSLANSDDHLERLYAEHFYGMLLRRGYNFSKSGDDKANEYTMAWLRYFIRTLTDHELVIQFARFSALTDLQDFGRVFFKMHTNPNPDRPYPAAVKKAITKANLLNGYNKTTGDQWTRHDNVKIATAVSLLRKEQLNPN